MMEVTGRGVMTMKTVEEIIKYLELELAVAHELYDEAKGLDPRKAMIHMVRVSTITHLLESIKGR
jgi:hypothetical protein